MATFVLAHAQPRGTMGVKAQGNRRLEQEGEEGLGGCAGENKGIVHNRD